MGENKAPKRIGGLEKKRRNGTSGVDVNADVFHEAPCVTPVTVSNPAFHYLQKEVLSEGKFSMSTGLRELRAKKPASSWSWLAAAVKDPSLIAIVSFCAIGLLVTLNLMLRFPDLGALIAQYNQF
jgi:hypothetical protein